VADRWAPRVGLAYVLAILAFTVAGVLASWSVPGLRVWPGPIGEDGYSGIWSVLGWIGLVVLGYAAWLKEFTTRQGWMLVAVALWLGATALSMVIHGDLADARFWDFTAIGSGLVAGAALATPSTVRATMLGLGWFFGWGSIMAGVSDMFFDWPRVLVPEDRFVRWVRMLGVDVDTFGALSGVTPGRVYVGLTCGLLLVYTVRTLLAGDHPRWMWVSCVGLTLAPLWALSRTGGVIIVLGLLAPLVPWERFRIGWLLASVFGVILLPLSLSWWLSGRAISDGTTAWRFDLWLDYLSRPGMWTPFGIGPQPFSLAYADHAHHQVLEAFATGGWVGLGGIVAFIALGTAAAHQSAQWDARAAIAVVFGMAAIFQVDVVTMANRYATINIAFVLIVTVVVNAAASPPHPRLLRKSPDPLDR